MTDTDDARRELQQHLQNGGVVEGSVKAPAATAKALATVAAALSIGISANAPVNIAPPVGLSASFTQAANQRTEDIYHGREGYNRMIGEMRESLYREIPEARGHIEIINHLTEGHEESSRLQQSLGLSAKDAETMGLTIEGSNLNSGEAMPRHLDGGRYVCIASATDPDTHNLDVDKMSFEEIRSHARIIAHETMHCLDPLHQDASLGEGEQSIDPISYAENFRKSEMFADVGAQALLMNNGDKKANSIDLGMGYNIDAPSRSKDDTRFGYDNGPQIIRLASQYGDNQPGLTGFNMNHWRHSMLQAQSIRTQAESTSDLSVSEDMHQARILSAARDKFIADALPKETTKDSETLKANVEQLFDEPTHDVYKPGTQHNALTRQSIDITAEARKNYHAWITERADILPAAKRVVASYEWLKNGEKDPLPAEATMNNRQDHDVAIGRAALKFQQTRDALDKDMFDTLTQRAYADNNIDVITGKDPYGQRVERTKDYNRVLNSPEAATRLANGETRDTVFKSLPPETPDKPSSQQPSLQQQKPAPGFAAPGM